VKANANLQYSQVQSRDSRGVCDYHMSDRTASWVVLVNYPILLWCNLVSIVLSITISIRLSVSKSKSNNGFESLEVIQSYSNGQVSCVKNQQIMIQQSTNWRYIPGDIGVVSWSKKADRIEFEGLEHVSRTLSFFRTFFKRLKIIYRLSFRDYHSIEATLSFNPILINPIIQPNPESSSC
jgi:hypothetical protein